MSRTFQDRELFSAGVAGLALQGTHHIPRSHNRAVTGVLLLTGILTPRAAHGDSAVYWAEAFADCGYPCFRVDLPGSGDSEGSAQKETLASINAGGQAHVVAELVRLLAARHGLRGIVIVGHCAGAVSALFAAAGCTHCCGLVLLAPYFHLPQVLGMKTRRTLIDWAAQNRLGGMLSKFYLRTTHVRRSLSRRNKPPKNANRALLASGRQVAAAGLPVLVLKAAGPKASGAGPTPGEFDYLAWMSKSAGNRSRIQLETVERAHHTFANRAGREGVVRSVEGWLAAFFPRPEDEITVLKTATMVLEPAFAHSEPGLAPVDSA